MRAVTTRSRHTFGGNCTPRHPRTNHFLNEKLLQKFCSNQFPLLGDSIPHDVTNNEVCSLFNGLKFQIVVTSSCHIVIFGFCIPEVGSKNLVAIAQNVPYADHAP